VRIFVVWLAGTASALDPKLHVRRCGAWAACSERFWLNLQTAYDLELEWDRLEGRLEREVQVLAQAG
jgi:plasmid maintenance system antidote protein VapI